MSCCDSTSITLNAHTTLTTNPAGISKTPIGLILISGIMLKTYADLLKLGHSNTFFRSIRLLLSAFTRA